MENVRDRINLEFIDRFQIDQIITRQSKLRFKGIADHYSTFSVYKLDKKTVFDKPIYLGFTILKLSKLLLYEFYSKRSEPYWQYKIHLHFMDTDSFVLRFDTNKQELTSVLQQTEDEIDFSELDKSHEFFDPHKNVIGKMEFERSPVLVLGSFIASRSKSNSCSYQRREAYNTNTIQNAKQKRIQHTPKYTDYINSLFNSETLKETISSLRSKLYQFPVEKKTE